MAVKKRLERMREKRLLRVSALLNTVRLRLHLILVSLEAEDHRAREELADRFRECPWLLLNLLGVGWPPSCSPRTRQPWRACSPTSAPYAQAPR